MLDDDEFDEFHDATEEPMVEDMDDKSAEESKSEEHDGQMNRPLANPIILDLNYERVSLPKNDSKVK